jgi:hypothetical protein
MIKNNKQTAVEWLVEQLTEVDYNCINKTFLQSDKTLAGYKLRELLQQAKEMEKEHMCKFAYKCHNHHKVYGDFNIEQYYNETYGKNHIGDVNKMVGGEQ